MVRSPRRLVGPARRAAGRVVRRIHDLTDLDARRSGPAPVAPPPPPPPPPGLDLASLLPLLYPAGHSEEVAELARSLAGGEVVTDVSVLRRVLSYVDRQFHPSPFQVRFGEEDLVEVEVEGLRLVIDRQDFSVGSQLLNRGTYEPHLTAALRRVVEPGMTVLDVGANIGYYAVLLGGLVGPDGRVIAVEASSENCRLVLLNALHSGLANVELLPVAADAERGWAYFSSHVGSNGGFLPGPVEDLRDGRGLVVPTFRLDDLIDRPVDFVKVDVEGAEGRVVAGMQAILGRHRPIVATELSREMLSRVSGVTAEDYLGGFAALGYRLFVVERDTTEVVSYPGPGALLEGWTDPYRLEDLLLIPEGRPIPGDWGGIPR